RVSIHDRPKEVELKERYGDWESDLILFKKQSAAVSVQYERKSMLAKLHKTKDKTARENRHAINQTLVEVPDVFKRSLTFDNGLENSCHLELRDQFYILTYFCDPYSSWQKGGVENLNGLIRQYLPKNADVSKLTDDGLREIEERLNNRPRKSLNYQTPNEIYQKVCQLNNQIGDALNP
ncbi:MAG: IS30 family transposase, partial [Candidatus Komeilibacteria bacterium]|nr:IS30 family transposase [Candidatus Komeilibacteria bacterium]